MGAYINGDYKSEYSGDQIDAAIGKVRTPDSTPTASSDNLVTSGGVKAALDQKQAVIEDLSTIRSNATDGKAAYDKIDEGLAKSDLDAGVQTSLNKADAAAPQSTTYTKTEVDNALAAKAAKNGSGSEDFNAKSVILPTTGSGSGTSQILGANSPVPGRYYLPDSASGGQGYTLATTDMVDQKADKDTDAVEGNLAEFDANGNPVDSGVPTSKIGEIDEKVTVLRNSAGIAEGIADTLSAGTAQEFVFRQSGGDGVNYMKRIKGKSVAFNQLVNYANLPAATTKNGVTFEKLGDGKIRVHGTSSDDALFYLGVKMISGHKYFVAGAPAGSAQDTYRINAYNEGEVGNGAVFTSTYSGTEYPAIQVFPGVTLDVVFTPQFVDLTLMFGAGNEPSTVAEFEALYSDSYYPYNAGKLISNDASEIETVGRNVWDEEWRNGYYSADSGEYIPSANHICSKNPIPVLPSTKYYTMQTGGYVCYYDENLNFLGSVYGGDAGAAEFTTPANCRYIRFNCGQAYGNTYQHNIAINIFDSSFNGQYEPYWKRRIELNIPELKDKDGNLVFSYGGMHGVGTAFDSMKPEADGFIHYANRVFSRVNLGDFGWTLWDSTNKVFMSGNLTSLLGNNRAIICSKYGVGQIVNYDSEVMGSADKSILTKPNKNLFVKDSAYSDAASFKAAMAGVYLVYEVATPAVVELAEPIPNAILVDSYGTEKAIFPTHEDGSPSAPFACDSNYSISVKNLVAKLNALNG